MKRKLRLGLMTSNPWSMGRRDRRALFHTGTNTVVPDLIDMIILSSSSTTSRASLPHSGMSPWVNGRMVAQQASPSARRYAAISIREVCPLASFGRYGFSSLLPEGR